MGSDIAAVYGIHGDEKSPLHLVSFLRRHGVDVFGPINDLAWEHDVRYVDRDLNRLFGRATCSYEERCKPTLHRILQRYNLIIDLHSYRMRGKPMIIQCEDVRLPDADMVWDVRTTSIQGSFCQYAYQNGTTCISLELPHIDSVQEHIEEAKQILRNVFSDTMHATTGSERKLHTASKPGLFIPTVQIDEAVKPGLILGYLHVDGKHLITGRNDGVVKQVRAPGLVQEGSSLLGLRKRKNNI